MTEYGSDFVQQVLSSEDDVSEDDGINEEVSEKQAAISAKQNEKTKGKGEIAAENDALPSNN